MVAEPLVHKEDEASDEQRQGRCVRRRRGWMTEGRHPVVRGGQRHVARRQPVLLAVGRRGGAAACRAMTRGSWRSRSCLGRWCMRQALLGFDHVYAGCSDAAAISSR
uniref:Uncharacterized protein n=1 Tax=Oryza nivara TaxID=4536 RepID=A0A0E0FZ72_ORYNI